jgi:hypothetical protein
VLEVEVVKAGPFEPRGVYHVTATLYNNNEPVAGPDGGAFCGATARRRHGGGGAVTVHSGFALAGVHVDDASRLVFEVVQRKLSAIGAAPLDPSPVRGVFAAIPARCPARAHHMPDCNGRYRNAVDLK